MALKDADLGIKILGGLGVVALLMALVSNGDPDNDAWSGGPAEASSAAAPEGSPGEPEDPWTAGRRDDDDAMATCDGTAVFSADGGGVVRLPVVGPVAPFASPTCQLGGAATGEPVRLLQQALVACNAQAVTVDGEYGPQTRQAVRAVQESNGIAADGVYGPATRSVMAWPVEAEEGDASEGASCAGDPTAD